MQRLKEFFKWAHVLFVFLLLVTASFVPLAVVAITSRNNEKQAECREAGNIVLPDSGGWRCEQPCAATRR